jgi:hypothetical protein
MFAILIFDGVIGGGYYIDSYSGQLYTNTSGTQWNAFWEMFVNPTTIVGNSAWLVLIGIFSVGAGIVLTYVTKSDMFILYSFFVLIFMAGMLPLMALWNVVDREAFTIINEGGACLCTNPNISSCAMTCPLAIIIAAIIVGPIVIYWFFCCVEWLTARPVS